MRNSRILAGVFVGMFLLSADVQAQQPAWRWYEVDVDRNVRINVYLFWKRSCPRCEPALKFCDWLQDRYSWVHVYRFEISQYPANRQLYQQMAASLNRIGGQTPAMFYCKQMQIGYISYEHTGKAIESSLKRWYDYLHNYYHKQSARTSSPVPFALAFLPGLVAPPIPPPDLPPPPDLADLIEEPPPEEEKFYVPGWGKVQAKDLSLPTLTLVLAGCDAFNPCAFFVLLLLLSLLVHSQSRMRILIVGGVFVLFSGLMYFLFMAAWLNLFLVIGHLRFITLIAGLVALAIGLMNVKDFFWFKKGPSLSIPESSRPALFQRMTHLISASNGLTLLAGAASLAVVANLYELLCTSGFPMVYTRILTLSDLSYSGYYGYLALYNLIYVAPMALIVCGFCLTLGARKLTEYQGKVLKLLSGNMMLALGGILLIWPDILHSVVGAVGILVFAGGVSGVVLIVSYRKKKPPSREKDSEKKVANVA